MCWGQGQTAFDEGTMSLCVVKNNSCHCNRHRLGFSMTYAVRIIKFNLTGVRP